MPYPSLNDDGQTVFLDLHGASVDEALRLTEAVVKEAARRGRSRVRVVHGSSTSSGLYRNRTIKHALEDALTAGRFAPVVVDVLRLDDTLTLSLGVTSGSDTTPITLLDVQP